jgi:hypothetical protein
MTTISFTYANGFMRQINMTAFTPGDTENTAILTTADEENIVVSLADTPDIWEQISPFLLSP